MSKTCIRSVRLNIKYIDAKKNQEKNFFHSLNNDFSYSTINTNEDFYGTEGIYSKYCLNRTHSSTRDTNFKKDIVHMHSI